MSIKGLNIYTGAVNFAMSAIEEQIGEKLEYEFLEISDKYEILNSPLAKYYVDNLVLGAIDSYHTELQKELQKHGIELSDLVIKE